MNKIIRKNVAGCLPDINVIALFQVNFWFFVAEKSIDD